MTIFTTDKRTDKRVDKKATVAIIVCVLIIVIQSVRLSLAQKENEKMKPMHIAYDVDETDRLEFCLFFSECYDEEEESLVKIFKDDDLAEYGRTDIIEACNEYVSEVSDFYGFSTEIEVKSKDMGYAKNIHLSYYEYQNIGCYEATNGKNIIYINNDVLDTKNPQLIVYTVTHEFMHLYYYQMLDANRDKYMNVSSGLREDAIRHYMLKEMQAYDEGKQTEMERYFQENAGKQITERIIIQETMAFLYENDAIIFGR